MNNVVVYGTLKRNGTFSGYLREQSYVQRIRLVGFKMYDSGYGFPFIVRGGEKDVIYGELHKVNDRVLKNLDHIENVEGGLYSRINLQDTHPSFKEPTYIYVSELSHFDSESKEVPYGYWSVDNVYLQIMRVQIHDKVYEDIAKKIVFHMRFFDGDRTPTNKSYMRMVEKRLHIPIHTDIEEIFLSDIIIEGLAKELTEEEILKLRGENK